MVSQNLFSPLTEGQCLFSLEKKKKKKKKQCSSNSFDYINGALVSTGINVRILHANLIYKVTS